MQSWGNPNVFMFGFALTLEEKLTFQKPWNGNTSRFSY